MKVHENERKFGCMECEKTFKHMVAICFCHFSGCTSPHEVLKQLFFCYKSNKILYQQYDSSACTLIRRIFTLQNAAAWNATSLGKKLFHCSKCCSLISGLGRVHSYDAVTLDIVTMLSCFQKPTVKKTMSCCQTLSVELIQLSGKGMCYCLNNMIIGQSLSFCSIELILI